MRTFNLLFKLPKEEEFVIAAWAAICAYEKKLREMRVPFQTVLLTEESWLTNLLIPPMTFIAGSLEEVEDTKFDMVIDFSEDRALELGSTGRTAASAYGVILGLDNVNELVTLTKKVEAINDVLIIGWNDDVYNFFDKVSRTYPDIKCSWFTLDTWNRKIPPYTQDENVDMVLRSKIVVSVRSTATYLAACANRSVLEGYSLDEYPKEFFSKWSNPRYNMLCLEKKEDLDKNLSLVWRALERMINNLQKKVEANALQR